MDEFIFEEEPGFFDTFDVFGSGMFIFVAIFFTIIIGMIAYAIISGLIQWNRNNAQAELSVVAKIVTKRTDTYSESTWYYATFEVESGDRIEFSLSGREYGQIAEGDVGTLQFQGTRYLGFERMA